MSRARRLNPIALAALALALNALPQALAQEDPPETPATAQEEPPATASPPEPSHYVGAAACQPCHAEQWDGLEHNPHHGARVDGHEAGKVVECESCHGPGSLHAAAEGNADDPGFRSIRNLKTMKPEDADAVCVSCHRTSEQFHWPQSAHARNKVACRDCHSVHAPQDPGGQKLLSARNATAQCVKCHHDRRAELAHTAHMPLREGGMTCADCHNPHGSPGPHMIRAVSNVELCTTCHMDKRGPFLWEHPPVREDCVSCHLPHGSNNDKVLASKKPFLCQRCHIATRHPSTLYDQPDLVSNRLFNRSCTNCHVQVHGSNHPSGKTFLR
jgi:DmsE family decaheme c-type cytochrome